MTAPPSRRPPLAVVAALALLAPALVYLVRLPAFPTQPHNDYYVVLGDLLDEGGERLTHDPMRWLGIRSNEHRVTLPVLLWVANIGLTDGHNYVLSGIALALMAGIAVLLFRILPEELRRSPLGVAFAATIGLFAFTPAAAHNVFMGFSGTIWYLSNAFTVAAIAALAKAPPEAPLRRAVAPVIALGILGAFSYSTNFSLWPALVAGALLLPGPRKRAIFFALAGALVLVIAVVGYVKPSYHPDPVSAPRPLVHFLGAYLGSPFALMPSTARWIGWAGLAIAATLTVVAVRGDETRRRELAPWAMLALYGVSNGVGTAIGRAGFSLGMAVAPRYATLSSFFWLGLFVACGLLLRRWRPADPRRRVAAAVGLGAVLAFAIVAHERRGAFELAKETRKAAGQPAAKAALVYRVLDKDLLAPITLWPEHIDPIYEYLRGIGHRPFGRELFPAVTTLDPGALGERAPTLVTGRFDKVLAPRSREARTAGVVRVEGWARETGGRGIEELLLVDQDRRRQAALFVIGAARKEEEATASGREGDGTPTRRWAGLLRIDCAATRVRAFVRLDGEPELRPLRGSEGVPAAYEVERKAFCSASAAPPASTEVADDVARSR